MAEKAESKVTIHHDEIRRWAEARGGKPAVVKGTDILRINFPGGAEMGSQCSYFLKDVPIAKTFSPRKEDSNPPSRQLPCSFRGH